MKVEMWSIDKVIPYARNPRKNDAAVPKVMASLKEYGFRQPIVVDKDGVVIVGHTRLKAAQQLGMTEVPVHIATGLTDSQVKAYRIADNRTSEEAEWDQELLGLELSDLREADFDLNLTGFDGDAIEQALNPDEPTARDETYTSKIKTPMYEPKGDKPNLSEMMNREKTCSLIEKINSSKIPKDVAEFLTAAAERHTVFNFAKIAEFYCHADAETQDLIEQSGLVIIDFDKAIEYGFVQLTDRLTKLTQQEQSDADSQ